MITIGGLNGILSLIVTHQTITSTTKSVPTDAVAIPRFLAVVDEGG